ncbi:MAG: hypothetical protein ACI9UT_001179 [Flavobacteriales bacterium]|jgi:hypothetical protein
MFINSFYDFNETIKIIVLWMFILLIVIKSVVLILTTDYLQGIVVIKLSISSDKAGFKVLNNV